MVLKNLVRLKQIYILMNYLIGLNKLQKTRIYTKLLTISEKDIGVACAGLIIFFIV